ncbi:hypothetical protein [Microbispora sp. NPDC049125]|uniref:hypothetical protein n=1 Tax=Microbispora sp. NPDC049125 TaxID=3154929 RepID=UPI00346630F0
MDMYLEYLKATIHGTTFERCEECGRDLFAHVIGPDPLGLPHLWCLTPDQEREAASAGVALDREDVDNVYQDEVLVLVSNFGKAPCCDVPLAGHVIAPDWPTLTPRLHGHGRYYIEQISPPDRGPYVGCGWIVRDSANHSHNPAPLVPHPDDEPGRDRTESTWYTGPVYVNPGLAYFKTRAEAEGWLAAQADEKDG